MATHEPTAGPHEIAFEAFGVRLAVSTSDVDALDMVSGILPPGWRPCASEDATPHFALLRELAGTYTILRGGSAVHQGVDLDLAVGLLDGQIRSEVSQRATEMVFVHAGVVAHGGRAILLPGVSFAGKTTLTAALVKLGAAYYSDEFAVLDDDGLVHAYPRDLSLRDNGKMPRSDTPVESLGGSTGADPVPVGLVAFTEYRRNGQWNPETLSPGAGGLALLPHAMAVRARSAPTVGAVARALGRGAIVLRSQRGEADEVAPLLLGELHASAE